MKRNLKELTGYHIGATDGEVGRVTDFLFDNTYWTIRYLVVETGNWLAGRKVLLSPQALQGIDHEKKLYKVNLTIDQVKHSPIIDMDSSVSRQQEEELHQHYPWTGYWGQTHDQWPGGLGTVGMMTPVVTEPLEDAVHHAVHGDEEQNTGSNVQQKSATEDERHLFTANNVKEYTIAATNGDVGHVGGFIIDDSSWKIDSLILDTGSWLPGKKVILSPERVKGLDWPTSCAKVDLSKDEVKHLPEYHADKPIVGDH